jgi:Flp pilus assembly protein TadD
MSRTVAAVAILISTLSAGTVHAQVRPTVPVSGQTAPQTQAAAPRSPASAEQRAAADRMDPLTRSVFWAREQEVDPRDPIAGVKAAQALRELGQHEQAAATAQGVLLVQPQNVEAMLEVGRAHIARGQGFYGIAALEQARDLSPRDWRPLSLLGVAYHQVKREADARQAWNTGLTLSPDNPEILTNAAMAQTEGGDAAGAETLLRRAAAQPNASTKIRLNLALVLGLQGKTAEAEQIIRRDLPPEMADRNLAWLRARTAAGAGNGTSPTPGRTWSSLQGR